MCGIAGVVAADPQTRGRVSRMVALLRHRGPDDEGVADLGGAALGNTRLSILDLEHGHQPMSTADGEVSVVFNGEIYNYPDLRADLERRGVRLQTRCDTEILLHLYRLEGARLVARLDGMFALAIWDSTRKRLFLARDHLGQKPLFYCRTAAGFGFASEIKALLGAGLIEPRLDLDALYHYVSLRFIPDDLTLFRGVRKLPAAHYLVYENGAATTERYWELTRNDPLSGPERDLIDALDDRLDAAVDQHLLSDVPVGCFLSGGIDSSLVTALAASRGRETPATFSIGVRERDFDELPFARIVAEQYGTRHHEEVVDANLVELLPAMVWHLEEPADPFGVGVYLAARLASRHVKVVLSGDGGDELFAGYDRYRGLYLADLYRLLPGFVRETVLRKVVDAIPESYSYNSFTQKLRWIQRMAAFDGGDRYAESMSFLRFSEEAKGQLFTADARARVGVADSRHKILEHFGCAGFEELVDCMLYTDLMTRIPSHLLPIVDRMAMAHSVEVRCPFMEHRVVEFGMRIPARYKLRRGTLKYALRRVGERYLPSEIVRRGKQGFGFPLAYWMKDELRGLLDRAIEESRLVDEGVFERAYLQDLLAEHVSGRRDHNYRLWLVMNLELWHRLFVENMTTEALGDWMASSAGGGSAARSAVG